MENFKFNTLSKGKLNMSYVEDSFIDRMLFGLNYFSLLLWATTLLFYTIVISYPNAIRPGIMGIFHLGAYIILVVFLIAVVTNLIIPETPDTVHGHFIIKYQTDGSKYWYQIHIHPKYPKPSKKYPGFKRYRFIITASTRNPYQEEKYEYIFTLDEAKKSYLPICLPKKMSQIRIESQLEGHPVRDCMAFFNLKDH